MKASDLMFRLQNIIKTHGDLPVASFTITAEQFIQLLDVQAENAETKGTKPTHIFITNN